MTTTWQTRYARRHARVEIERPARPPATASVLAVIDEHIAALEERLADPDERPLPQSFRSIRLSALRMHRGHVERGGATSDELLQAAIAWEGRTR